MTPVDPCWVGWLALGLATVVSGLMLWAAMRTSPLILRGIEFTDSQLGDPRLFLQKIVRRCGDAAEFFADEGVPLRMAEDPRVCTDVRNLALARGAAERYLRIGFGTPSWPTVKMALESALFLDGEAQVIEGRAPDSLRLEIRAFFARRGQTSEFPNARGPGAPPPATTADPTDPAAVADMGAPRPFEPTR